MKKTMLWILTAIMALMIASACADNSLMIGDTVVFGHYEQDGISDNGREEIEWLVLEKEGNMTLLISKYGLEAMPYNSTKKAVTWENSTLRYWLNHAFLNSAFTEQEQDVILTTKVSNATWEGNTKYETTNGKHTVDKIFLLSYAEAGQYFTNNNERRLALTKHVTTSDPGTRMSDGAWWWLRSAGNNQMGASDVRADGTLGQSRTVNNPHGIVRPVMWIDAQKLK